MNEPNTYTKFLPDQVKHLRHEEAYRLSTFKSEDKAQAKVQFQADTQLPSVCWAGILESSAMLKAPHL